MFISAVVPVVVVNAAVVTVINMTQAGLGKHQAEEHQEEAGQEHLHRHQERLQDLLLLPPGDHYGDFYSPSPKWYFTSPSWCIVELSYLLSHLSPGPDYNAYHQYYQQYAQWVFLLMFTAYFLLGFQIFNALI